MRFNKAFIGAAFAAALGLYVPVYAGAEDYVFEPVEMEVKKGEDVTVAVRLIEKATKKPIPDAVVIGSRIDMAPDKMPTMEAPLSPIPSEEPGVYRFKTELAMAGRWRLSLAAKVQGEHETVEGEVVFTAKP